MEQFIATLLTLGFLLSVLGAVAFSFVTQPWGCKATLSLSIIVVILVTSITIIGGNSYAIVVGFLPLMHIGFAIYNTMINSKKALV
jgi:hypothetical protein